MYFSIYICLNDVELYCLCDFFPFSLYCLCHVPFFVMYDCFNIQKLKIKKKCEKNFFVTSGFNKSYFPNFNNY